MEENGNLEDFLKKEREVLKRTAQRVGSLWDKYWLPNYFAMDRGYECLTNIILPLYSYAFNDLLNLTSEGLELIPAFEKELNVMGYLNKNYLEEVKKMAKEIPEKSSERRGKNIFTPEEWVKISDMISRILEYVIYREGYSIIREDIFVNKQPLKDVVRKQMNLFEGFLASINNHSKYFPGGPNLSVNTFSSVDAHDESVIPDALESKDINVLLKNIPEKGIQNVIFQDKEEIREDIRKSLEYRTMFEDNCTVSMLRRLLNPQKMEKYVYRVKGYLRQTSEIV